MVQGAWGQDGGEEGGEPAGLPGGGGGPPHQLCWHRGRPPRYNYHPQLLVDL
jgi:hypothetical protein